VESWLPLKIFEAWFITVSFYRTFVMINYGWHGIPCWWMEFTRIAKFWSVHFQQVRAMARTCWNTMARPSWNIVARCPFWEATPRTHNRTLIDNNYPMHVIRHYDKFVQRDNWKMFRYIQPILPGYYADRRQSYCIMVFDCSKIVKSVVRANGDKIISRRSVIVLW